MSSPTSRKTYWVVFGALFVFTLLEVAVADPRLGLGKMSVGFSLVGMALVKAALVAWFFMHLNHERKALKLTVIVPFLFFAIYPLALIGEAGWRLLR